MTQPRTAVTPTLEMQLILDELAAFDAPALTELSTQTARQVPLPVDAVIAPLATTGEGGSIETVGDVSDLLIPGPDGGILTRPFTPEGEGPFPVFAPTDAALAERPAETLAALQDDPATLTAVLQYHLVSDGVTTADLAELGTALTFTGDTVTVETTADGILTIDGAPVIEGDIVAGNGIIHIIDGVLLPPDQ